MLRNDQGQGDGKLENGTYEWLVVMQGLRIQIQDSDNPICFVLVQSKMSWCSLLTAWYSRQPLGIKAQSCPGLR